MRPFTLNYFVQFGLKNCFSPKNYIFAPILTKF